MKLSWKLILYYLANLSNLLIAILLILYERNILILQIICIIVNGIANILSIFHKYNKKYLKKQYFKIVILIAVSVQILIGSYYSSDMLRISYLLLKVQEYQVVQKLTPVQTYFVILCYNICQISLLIYWDEIAILYVIIFYGSLKSLKRFRKQQPEDDLPSHTTKPMQTQRNSEIINLIQDSISHSWMQRLQNIPVGIMIVKKDNLQIVFQNQSLFQIFEGVEDVEKFLMHDLEFKFAYKRRRNKRRETSIKLQSRSLPNNNPIQIQSCKKVSNSNSLSLQTILQELQNGNMFEFQTKENHLDLLAQLNKTKALKDDDEIRHIQCKVVIGQQDSEYLIIVDDITLQAYLQKLETREKFQVRIIDSFSHELRTPLNGAKLFLDALLNDTHITENQRQEFIIPAQNALKLQGYLIRDIVDFTQFHSQQIQYEFEEFQFERIVEEISDIFRPQCQLKNLGFHINVKNVVPLIVKSDYARIMQILVNLITNSIKYSENGNGLIILEISATQDNSLLFCIKDNGVGIESDKLRKIQNFLKSFNQHRDFTTHEEWEGLGLLVSQMNLFKLAPQIKTQLKIFSKGFKEGTSISFKIKTSQTINTTLLRQTTIQRPSVKIPSYTLPNLCFGLQGILIVNNPRSNSNPTDSIVPYIPTRQTFKSFYHPRSSSGILNQLAQQETDLIQDEDTDRGDNPYKNLINLNKQQKHYYLLDQSHKKKHTKRKQSNFSVSMSEYDSSQSNRPNTLISRLIQREEEEFELEQQFEKIQFQCNCARILSVDDDSFNQRALQVIIGQLGLRAQLAYNGAQAIDMVKNIEKCSPNCKGFHFILMDCQMPVIDGWAATKILVQLMREKEIPEIPIIGLTAFNSKMDIERCLDVGMREVLSKPLDINTLKQVLLRLFIE